MWKCPVCEKESEGVFCAFCGFDTSQDYEHYPTLQKLKNNPEAISRLKEKAKENVAADDALEALRKLGLDDAVLESVARAIRDKETDEDLLNELPEENEELRKYSEDDSLCESKCEHTINDHTEKADMEMQPLDVRLEKKSKCRKGVRIAALLVALLMWIVLWADVFLAGIIRGNIMIAAEVEIVRPIVATINSVIISISGCSRSGAGLVVTSSGVMLNPSVGSTSLKTGMHTVLMCGLLMIVPVMIILMRLLREIRPRINDCSKSSARNRVELLAWNMLKLAVFTVSFIYAFSFMIEIIIPRFIHGSIMVAVKYEPLRDVLKQINVALADLINASRSEHGAISLENGIVINPLLSVSSVQRGVGVMILCITTTVFPVILASRKAIQMIKKCLNCVQA